MSEQRTLLGHIRTFLIVTLITVMVWLLAESRMVQTQTVESQIVLLTMDTDGGTRFVVRQSVDEPGERPGDSTPVRTITIKLEGSAAGLDQFVRLMHNRVELTLGQEIPAQPGTHLLDLRSILHQSFQNSVHGVIITEVSPESISVEVDELVTREFQIRVDMPDGVELDGAPRADPPTVRVVGPKSVLAKVKTNEAIVSADPLKVSQLTQGRRETIPDVAVDLPGIDRGDWATQIVPAQVDVFVTLRTLTETMSIDRLPVQVLIAPAEIGKWVVEIADADKDLVNVLISGPAQAIKRIQSGEVVPRAFVSMTFEELERRIRSKPAQILGLPPGCLVESPEFTVNLQISPISLVVQDPAGGDAGSP